MDAASQPSPTSGDRGSTDTGSTAAGSSQGRVSIDIARLTSRLDELARIGAIEGTHGCSRLALTPEDGAGRDLVVTWMRDLGLTASVDAVGNVVAVTPFGDGPPVMMGSHIDTVATGGRYDGNLGVLAGLEVIETIIDAQLQPERPLAVAFFTDEEGSRFAPDMLGSLVYVGAMAAEDALQVTDSTGVVLGDELDAIGYRGGSPCPGPAPHAFVELHVEQGPVLEAAGVTIGAVTGVQGISWTEFTVTGQSNHAGTTPMTLRHDAAYVAAAIATRVRGLVSDLGGSQVGTVGSIELHPNLVNVVAATATLTVDLRNTDDAVLRRAEREIIEYAESVAAAEGCGLSHRALARSEPVEFDEEVVAIVERAATARGASCRRLPSGAGHDAQMLARVCPTAMVFVPSVGGISHNPAEYTAPHDLEAGANVLLDVVLELAEVPQ